MVLKKDWLQNEIDTEPNPAIKLALERVMQKYTESPKNTPADNQTTLKDFDRDATYKKVVTFYIDKKGYTKEQAHEVAMDVVKREIERRRLQL